MTSLDDVLKVFREWLHLPDPGVVEVTLGAVAANRMQGDPVWLGLIGPPGSGKTETIGALSRLPDIHHAATLTEASLLSGTPKKDAGDAKGGLLRSVGDFGILLVKDFTSVLAMNRDSRSQVLAALREIYDGSWTRHVGTDGGRTLSWSGKVGLIAGCTPAIDSHHAVVSSMGERMALFRLPPTDDDAQAERALEHVDSAPRMRAELAEVVESLFAGIEGWHLPPRALTSSERTRLIDLASLAVRCRSAVERDTYSREIQLVPEHEAPGRLVIVLARLLAGLELVGVDHPEAWRALTTVALSSMPAVRRMVLERLVEAEHARTTTSLATEVGYPTQTVRRTLEDLACHGVTVRTTGGKGKADLYATSDWTVARWPDGTVPESPESDSSLYLSLLRKEGISGTVSVGERS